MFELVKLNGNSHYIESPAKIGLVELGGNRVCFIDSGNDKEAGRKLRQILDKNGWKLEAIYNTHSNADHIGGNKYLQSQTGCRIYAKGIECDFIKHTVLEPALLYGGYPIKELRNKFLMAQESMALSIEECSLPDCMEMIELPGHFFDMVGFRTADDVVYLADCLSSRETLEKYQIGFIYDVESYINTLETVKQMRASWFVPAHAAVTEDIAPLAQYNIDKVMEIAEKILSLCQSPVSFETILQKLFETYQLRMTIEQYALVGSTVKSYLAWLKNSGKLSIMIDNNLVLWEKAR